MVRNEQKKGTHRGPVQKERKGKVAQRRGSGMEMTQELDKQIAQKMKSAESLPRAPEALVDRTIRRMTAIEKGRLAEQELARGDPEKLRETAATALIGQMALHRPLPDGFEPGKESVKLSGDPKFIKATEGKAPGDLLKEIQNGKLAKDLSIRIDEPQQKQNLNFNRTQNRSKENNQPRM